MQQNKPETEPVIVDADPTGLPENAFRELNEGEEYSKELETAFHKTIKKVTGDIETLNFNTAISQMMIFINDCYKLGKVSREMMTGFVKMLSCFAPHLGEELYYNLTGGAEGSVAYAEWPAWDESKIVLQKVTVIIQVNGKMRGRFEADKDADREVVEKKAMEAAAPYLEGKTVRKVIVVPNKIVNIVAS